VTAAKALHTAFFREGSLTVVISSTARQSGEFVMKAAHFLPALGIKQRGDGNNRCSLLLPNGSRMVGLPGTEGTIRGYSAASLVVIDEAALVSDEQYKVMSTPRGKRASYLRGI
jgi:hypothetical protein